MPPCISLNSNLGDSTCTDVNCVNALVSAHQPCGEVECLHTHCRNEIFLILQRLIICSDAVIDILNKSLKVDQIKSSTQKTLTQCSTVHNKCGSLSSSLNQGASPSCNKSGEKSSTWSKLSENNSLQHWMAQNDSDVDSSETPNDSGFNEGSGGLHYKPASYDCRTDLVKLEKNCLELLQCCFYFGSIDSQAAKDLLCKEPTGTFLIRDSSHSKYLYSLSVKTERGATSVRIIYNKGLFQFDSDERIRNKLPQFDSVLGLLDFHVMVTHDGVNKSWQWEENSGKNPIKVILTKPLKSSVASLAHLSRVKINQCLDNAFISHFVDSLPLISDKLKEFIKDYHYRI